MQMPHDHESELDLLGGAERDQFVYDLTIAYMLTDPTDRQAFQRAVYGGIVAALTLLPAPTGPYPDPRASPDLSRRRRAWLLLDRIRDHHDPAADWPGFLTELWNRRGELTAPTPTHPPEPPR
jgi:hypothetical protein